MNLSIWKYPLKLTDEQIIEMPAGTPLSVGEQDGQLMLWALVEPDKPMLARRIRIIGTGHPIDGERVLGSFLGTIQSNLGLVWHIFWSSCA